MGGWLGAVDASAGTRVGEETPLRLAAGDGRAGAQVAASASMGMKLAGSCFRSRDAAGASRILALT